MHKRSPELLIVDNDPNIFEILTPTLDFCTLKPVFSEKSLKPTLQRSNIDGVLLDYNMGPNKGPEFIPLIRQYFPHAFIILLTAYGSKEILIEVLHQNLSDYIEKPMQLEAVKNCIIKHLRPQFGETMTSVQYAAEIDIIKCHLDNIHYTNNDYSLEQFCIRRKLNYKYLCRLFKKKEGISFREYKIKKKMELAKKLLTETTFTINEISNRLHYMNPSAFMKMFKNEAHITPTQFRK